MKSTPLVKLAMFPETRLVGRPTVLEALGLTIEDIVKTYKEQGSLPKTAAVLGISANTCKKYLHLVGQVGPQGGRIQPFPWRKREEPPAQKWFQEHRNDKLPRNVTELATMSGLTTNQIKKFLYVRQQAALAYLKSLGDLRELEPPGYVIDIIGRKIPTGYLADYVIKLDRFDLTVRIKGVLRFGGEVNIMMSFRTFKDFMVSRN